jgi:hypothetical protein
MIHTIGTLRETLPGKFTDVYQALTRVDGTKGNRYLLNLRKTPTTPAIKSSFRAHKRPDEKGNLPMDWDVTVEDWDHPERYGLGKLIADEAKG